MIDTLLQYNHDVKDSQLQSEGYIKDDAFFMDDITANSGYFKRKQLTANGIADFEGPIHMDVVQQPKAILNGVQILVKLFQHDDNFRLVTANGATYRVEIVDTILKVCNIKVTPKVTVAQDELLAKTPAVYPLWKRVIKTFGIAQGSYTFNVDDIFHNEVPAKLYVALAASAAYSGDYDRNPFNFWHYYLNYLELAVDGQSVPAVAFQPKYQDDPTTAGQTLDTGYVHEYLSLFKLNYPQAEGNWIQRSDFPGGYAIYVFDLKPGVEDNLFSTLQSGHTRLTARFERELPEPVTLIAYGVFPSEFKIDQVRNVIQ